MTSTHRSRSGAKDRPGPRPHRGPRAGAGGAGVLALLLLAGPAVAQERERRPAPGTDAPPAERQEPDTPAEDLVDRFAARVSDALGLDRAEGRRLVEELQRSRRERVFLAQRRRQVMAELAPLVRSGGPDQARVASLLQEMLELRVRRARVDVEEDRRLAEFLTPLQRARLFHLKQRLAERALDARGPGAARRP